MIVITDIKWYEVEGNKHTIMHDYKPWQSIPIYKQGNELCYETFDVVYEDVTGRHLYRKNYDGSVDEICLGIEKSVADVLQWHQDIWDKTTEERDFYCSQMHNREVLLQKARKAGIFERIKWVFKGFNY